MYRYSHSTREPSTGYRSRQQLTSLSPDAHVPAVHHVPPVLYRQAGCACGGVCPRCQSESPVSATRSASSNNRFETEADRMAESVMRKVDQPVSDRQRRYPGFNAGSPSSSRLDLVGEPLSPVTRQFFESRLGRDFSHVRVHRGEQANMLAHNHHARAFTLGQDIVFAENQYQPASRQGKRLLAHELVHVMQQSRYGAIPQVSAAPQMIQREVDTSAAAPAGARSNTCQGWESDRESFTKRVAEHYVMDALGTVGTGLTMNCIQNGVLCIWQVLTPNGTISVGVSLAQMPGTVIARQVYASGVPRCEYDYSCSAGGQLVLTRRRCQ